MNDVVNDSRMIGIFHEQWIEHRHGLLILRHAGIIGRLRREQRERVERARIGVEGKVGVQFGHRGGITFDAGPIVALIGLIKTAQRRDVLALAQGLCRVRPRGLHLSPAVCDRGCVGPIPNLVEQAHRDTPVRHGAARVRLRNFFELPLRLLVPKIVQQRDAAGEARLDCRCTGHRERHGAQVLSGGRGRGCRARVIGGGNAGGQPDQENQ